MAKRKVRIKPVYTDAFRAEAVAALCAAGYPGREGALSKTAKQFNIPVGTLYRWTTGQNNPPPTKLENEKKQDLAALIEAELFQIMKIIPDKRERANFSQLTVGFGVFFDKLRLLKGLPTEIVGILPELIEAFKQLDTDPVVGFQKMLNRLREAHEAKVNVDA